MTPSNPPEAAILEALARIDADDEVDALGDSKTVAAAYRAAIAEQSFMAKQVIDHEMKCSDETHRAEAAESREKTLIEQADKHDREWERKFNSLRGELAAFKSCYEEMVEGRAKDVHNICARVDAAKKERDEARAEVVRIAADRLKAVGEANELRAELADAMAKVGEKEARIEALSGIVQHAEFVVRGGDKDSALKILRGEVLISPAKSPEKEA